MNMKKFLTNLCDFFVIFCSESEKASPRFIDPLPLYVANTPNRHKKSKNTRKNPYILALFVLWMNWCRGDFSLHSVNFTATNAPH